MPPRENERVPVCYEAMNMTKRIIDDKLRSDVDVDMGGAQQRGETGGKRSKYNESGPRGLGVRELMAMF